MAWFRDWLYGGGDTASTASATGAGRGDGSGVGDRPLPDATTERDGRGGRQLPGSEAVLPDEGYPGERLGLPEHGPGSVATLARRAAQFLLDALLAGLVAALFTYPDLPQNWSLLSWAVLVVIPLATIGMTPAMAMLGVRVLRLDRPGSAGVGLLWALVRTASVFFVIPALLVDRDVRGVHDRATRTIVVRTR